MALSTSGRLNEAGRERRAPGTVQRSQQRLLAVHAVHQGGRTRPEFADCRYCHHLWLRLESASGEKTKTPRCYPRGHILLDSVVTLFFYTRTKIGYLEIDMNTTIWQKSITKCLHTSGFFLTPALRVKLIRESMRYIERLVIRVLYLFSNFYDTFSVSHGKSFWSTHFFVVC